MRVAAIKPKEGLKPKLFRLKKNTGYPVEELADEWGVSADTLRRDAKRLDALLFVETSPGEWVQCVVHPDTTTERKS
jgi:predicted DNA-binding transcriptional regulator YafY